MNHAVIVKGVAIFVITGLVYLNWGPLCAVAYNEGNNQCCDDRAGCEGCVGIPPEISGYDRKYWFLLPSNTEPKCQQSPPGYFECDEEEQFCVDVTGVPVYIAAGCNQEDWVGTGDIQIFGNMCNPPTEDMSCD